MSTPSGTVIVAAHNEEAVIGRCLSALGDAIASGRIQTIVVCNGCTDATAQRARAYPGVTVIELAVASKIAALRAGDRVAVPAGPRVYLDADVVLNSRALLAVLHALQPGGHLAVRPRIRFDSGGASRTVRRWYRVRAQLPSIRNALWGAGLYALSSAGRERFGEFPDVVSDDLFIDSLFAASERGIIDDEEVVVRTPQRLGDLLRILKRSYRTQAEIPSSTTERGISDGQRRQAHELTTLLRRNPTRLLDIGTYAAVIVVARIQARFDTGKTRWERDESSRTGA